MASVSASADYPHQNVSSNDKKLSRPTKLLRSIKSMLVLGTMSSKAKKPLSNDDITPESPAEVESTVKMSDKLCRDFDHPGTANTLFRKRSSFHLLDYSGNKDAAGLEALAQTTCDLFHATPKASTHNKYSLLVSGLRQHSNVMEFPEAPPTSGAKEVATMAGNGKREEGRKHKRRAMELLRSPLIEIGEGQYAFAPELAVMA